MLYNIKPLHLHRVFHGIRFKVNKDWVSGIDTLLFFVSIPRTIFQHKDCAFPFFSLFLSVEIKQ